ncbi:class-III pyridoxal-phosphate-dependent aminotransferase [Pseudohaliea rubra]|uniref:PLP-dependent aminotransferase (Class III) n=1 Tax=Pseudohaliea rubra DSM 19751 TaxID=1265313 RepID=A0A095VSS2_9GAMM|nr:aspartate aminotransferase family protein [Pseudohaliea rubra]KGE04507.1 PLP-dependent aminotransferase (class III) [Pseudohaliea rubra DSM 19751]
MAEEHKAPDWDAIENWDRRYYLHNTMAAAEHSFTGVERVDGNYITLSSGARLLDFQSQLVSDSLGHRHAAPHDAIKEAMERYGHVFFGMANEYRARAAKLLVEDILGAPASWASRVRFLTSGTEAVENAVQAARLFTGKPLIMTQAHSFHGMASGSTFLRGYRGNLTLQGQQGFSEVRDIPGVPAPGYIPIPPPEPTDFPAEGELPSLVATEQLIRACGPENIAAIITEPMFGAAGLMPHADYYRGLFDLLRRYGILWIDDEVLCGAGRLGKWFGYQLTEGVEPDIMIVGKGINGSSLPSGGMVVNEAIGAFLEGARWWSGSTWDGHPLVCASIVGTLSYMLDNDILATVHARGAYLRDRLEALARKHTVIGRIAGAGLYYAVDLVGSDGRPLVEADRYTNFSGDLSQYPNAIVSGACAEKGVFLGGFVPNTIKCAPPFTISESEIDVAMDAFSYALDRLAKTC